LKEIKNEIQQVAIKMLFKEKNTPHKKKGQKEVLKKKKSA